MPRPMIVSKPLAYTLSLLLLLLLTLALAKFLEFNSPPDLIDESKDESIEEKAPPTQIVNVNRPVSIEEYFDFIDSLVTAYDTIAAYPLSEHLLVRSNPWVIDTLANTDYYIMKKRDSFVYNQKKMTVLSQNTSLIIPNSNMVDSILSYFEKTLIDVNLPEFKLRIVHDSVEVFSFPIRIGQNTSKYLKMGDRITNLRTQVGSGKIIGHKRDPKFYNPVTGKQFKYTKRDDEKTTLMPRIPWIETEINGIRNGQLIHPTTNPKSLGKAYSNGCIGVKESDAWIIYYYSPIGTKINIRYDLTVMEPSGTKLHLDDIYGAKGLNREKKSTVQ